MSEMVERVARAMCEKHYSERFGPSAENNHVKMNVDGNWHLFTGAARAAIEAMVEPTTWMLNEAVEIAVEQDGNVSGNEYWQRMIQAALKEQA